MGHHNERVESKVMQSDGTVQVMIKGKIFKLGQDEVSCMKIFEQNKTDQIFAIDLYPQQLFLNLRRLLILANYNFPDYPPIRTSQLQLVIGQKMAKQFQQISNEQLNKLYQISQFLICNGIRKYIVATIACRIYFNPTIEGYTKKKIEMGVKRQYSQNYKNNYEGKYNVTKNDSF